jgi:uncharacterized tellurite resistance protein B-like protein
VTILRLFGWAAVDEPTPAAEIDTVRKITAALDALPPERARFIAAFAYILGRVAHADDSISPEETASMERLVAEHGGLPEDQAIVVVQMAKTQNVLFGGVENFLVTREFNQMATREQKLALIDCLFAVGAADESVSGSEDSAVSQVARELRIEHRDLMAVRARYRDRLSVLKNPWRKEGS